MAYSFIKADDFTTYAHIGTYNLGILFSTTVFPTCFCITFFVHFRFVYNMTI